ncbi:hypothetical protein BDZ94DRAFT_1266593 [Collybia nuda]|uniref:Uncharacterized protein n=1 Tax=Collybia nuda TaxID=64659 RepID=A0A9P5Y0V1_9AGAR|nr:hypothetical protein BDZ94DRAFT_1266593 [Collybia nuda]
MVDVLSECAALEVFIIHGNLVPRWVQAPTGLPLPKLRSIQLYGSAQTTTAFLQDLSTPNLSELSVVPYHHLDWMIFHARTGHLPFHTLKALTLSPYLSNDTSFETMRRTFNDASCCFPQIEELTLVGERSSSMLQALAETKDTKAWPGLMKLTLPKIFDRDGENALCRFVILRKAAGMPLPSILLDQESLKWMTRLDWLNTHVNVLGFDKAAVDFGGFIFPEIEDSDIDVY